jgi:hypothetical protein
MIGLFFIGCARAEVTKPVAKAGEIVEDKTFRDKTFQDRPVLRFVGPSQGGGRCFCVVIPGSFTDSLDRAKR